MRSPARQLRQALILYQEGDFARAQILLDALDVDQLEPDLQPEAHYLAGLVMVRRGDANEAAARFQACLQLAPRFFPALDAWGNVLAGLGDTHGAIEKYKRALAVATPGQSSHVLLNYGQVLMAAGYTVRALKRFRESFQRDQANLDAAYMAGQCFLRLGKARGALKWLKRALEGKPGEARYLAALGSALALAGREDTAAKAFAAAVKAQPAFADAHYNWAVLLASQEDYAGAIRRCKEGLRHNPGSFELMAQQVYCLRHMGAYDAALAGARRMREALGLAVPGQRREEFEDLLAANEAAAHRGLGRGLQARATLVQYLRLARGAAPHALAELRMLDATVLAPAKRIELTLEVRQAGETAPEGEEGPGDSGWQRSYWIIARDQREARRMARELEPQEANVRFLAGIQVLEELDRADRGILERTPAIPLD
ncbi:MAG: tetratricopeptide repeat protein [Planctomycetes bacterium]|nr:tetratricopeptide repeat protein [Planctomycetota bacterium]